MSLPISWGATSISPPIYKHLANTILVTNNPPPNKAPTEKNMPPSVPAAINEAITSFEPLAKASNVTPDKVSLNLNFFAIFVKHGAK